MGERSLGGMLKLERVALQREGPIPLIEKQQGTAAANHQQVLAPLVCKVGEQGARGVVQYANPGFFRYVFHGPVAPVTVEPVRQSRRLADIEIIETVIVVIPDCYSVVAVDVDTARPIEH